ncbi:MAG: hypothetical protein M3Y07_17760, partial [Acidobacteriota bacterium]|nr:hypothetical protein [Acidobacteriota bacterium]
RHRFTFNAVYELPFGVGRKWLASGVAGKWAGKIVGGWSLSTVTTAQSGAPFTVITQTNTTNAFSAGAQRADVSERVSQNPNLSSSARSVAQWFNTSAFSQPAIYRFGNEGVGILRGSGLVNVDVSLLREIRVTERIKLQIRGEFFNALNHTNLGLPGIAFGGAGFGVISSAGPARQVQVGARIAF